MKKYILLFAGLLLASTSQAQITLTSGSYPGSVIGTDSLLMTTAASAFPNLTAATNAIWDMDTVTDSSAVLYNYQVNPDTSFCQFADSDFYSFSTYTYQGNVQSSITSGGLINYGVDIDSETISLGSGNSVYIPIQHSVFSSPYTVIQFPATMSNSWSSNYESNFNYNLTYTLLSYSNAPGIVKSYITETDTVVGWGEMRVKDIAGSPSAWFHVLQVKTTRIVVDSFYLNGSLASSLILGGLGVTQGQSDTTYEQNYYRSGFITPLAQVVYPSSSFSTPSYATTAAQDLVNNSVANVINTSSVNIYPNPVSDNIISIDLPAISGVWSYELMDISGRTIAMGPLQTNGNHAQLLLPSGAAPGIYNIRLNNNGKQFCVRSLDVIK